MVPTHPSGSWTKYYFIGIFNGKIEIIPFVSHHPKMVEISLLGAHVFIYSFHLFGNQFSKIMFILLYRSTHIKDFKIRDDTCRHRC
jgi:hypothetical protein